MDVVSDFPPTFVESQQHHLPCKESLPPPPYYAHDQPPKYHIDLPIFTQKIKGLTIICGKRKTGKSFLAKRLLNSITSSSRAFDTLLVCDTAVHDEYKSLNPTTIGLPALYDHYSTIVTSCFTYDIIVDEIPFHCRKEMKLLKDLLLRTSGYNHIRWILISACDKVLLPSWPLDQCLCLFLSSSLKKEIETRLIRDLASETFGQEYLKEIFCQVKDMESKKLGTICFVKQQAFSTTQSNITTSVAFLPWIP